MKLRQGQRGRREQVPPNHSNVGRSIVTSRMAVGRRSDLVAVVALLFFALYTLFDSNQRISSDPKIDNALLRIENKTSAIHKDPKPRRIVQVQEEKQEERERQTPDELAAPEESTSSTDLKTSDGDQQEQSHTKQPLEKITKRIGGLYPRNRLMHYRTGAFANCTKESSRAIYPADLSLESGLLTVSCQTFRYKLTEESFKNRVGSVITGVLSSATAKDRRNLIRETWAIGKPVFFLVAGSWENIQKEFDLYGDLIWIDQEEAYLKITEKTASFFYLVDQVATALGLDYSHALKVDDDSYVALDRLEARFDFIARQFNHSSGSSWMWGNCNPRQPRPFREEANVWFISHSEYPEHRYPYYCSGAGYALSRKLVHCVAAMGHVANIRYLKMEDVYMGMLAERCRVSAFFDETDFVRPYRSGKAGDAVYEEVRRNRLGLGKINATDKWVVGAEMASKIIQHNVVSRQDMKDFHATFLRHKLYQLGTVRAGDKVQYFDDGRGNKWEEAMVLSTSKSNETIETIVNLRFDSDGETITRVFDNPYSGRWSKPFQHQDGPNQGAAQSIVE